MDGEYWSSESEEESTIEEMKDLAVDLGMQKKDDTKVDMEIDIAKFDLGEDYDGEFYDDDFYRYATDDKSLID